MVEKTETAKLEEVLLREKCEEIVLKYDRETNLLLAVVKHNSLIYNRVNGGTRIVDKPLPDALAEGVLLASAMTKKNVLYDLPWGGGKGIVIGKPNKSKKMLHQLGRFIESMNGTFQTTIDMGFTDEDAETIAETTQYIDSLKQGKHKYALGPCGVGAGVGVHEGLLTVLNTHYHHESIKGKKILVQGVGHVGSTICELLLKDGAEVFVTDINDEAIDKLRSKVKAIPPSEMFEISYDIFVPCATGEVLRIEDVPRYKFSIIVGGANNQLTSPEVGLALHHRNILYAPDFVVNAGGMIQAQCEYDHKSLPQTHRIIRDNIRRMTSDILREAKDKNIPPYQIADNRYHNKLSALHK